MNTPPTRDLSPKFWKWTPLQEKNAKTTRKELSSSTWWGCLHYSLYEYSNLYNNFYITLTGRQKVTKLNVSPQGSKKSPRKEIFLRNASRFKSMNGGGEESLFLSTNFFHHNTSGEKRLLLFGVVCSKNSSVDKKKPNNRLIWWYILI